MSAGSATLSQHLARKVSKHKKTVLLSEMETAQNRTLVIKYIAYQDDSLPCMTSQQKTPANRTSALNVFVSKMHPRLLAIYSEFLRYVKFLNIYVRFLLRNETLHALIHIIVLPLSFQICACVCNVHTGSKRKCKCKKKENKCFLFSCTCIFVVDVHTFHRLHLHLHLCRTCEPGLSVVSDLKTVHMPCCCRQRQRTSDTPLIIRVKPQWI